MNKLTAEKCREQFEEWLDKNSYSKQRDQMGLYEASFCQIAWIGWQASWQALEIALPALERQEKGEPVWIYWSGEVALPPVTNDVMVEVRMRSGNCMRAPAKTMRWRNFSPSSGDIIAYRVLETTPS